MRSHRVWTQERPGGVLREFHIKEYSEESMSAFRWRPARIAGVADQVVGITDVPRSFVITDGITVAIDSRPPFVCRASQAQPAATLRSHMVPSLAHGVLDRSSPTLPPIPQKHSLPGVTTSHSLAVPQPNLRLPQSARHSLVSADYA